MALFPLSSCLNTPTNVGFFHWHLCNLDISIQKNSWHPEKCQRVTWRWPLLMRHKTRSLTTYDCKKNPMRWFINLAEWAQVSRLKGQVSLSEWDAQMHINGCASPSGVGRDCIQTDWLFLWPPHAQDCLTDQHLSCGETNLPSKKIDIKSQEGQSICSR